MIEFERIVLATDFSACSSRARDYACALVDRFDSELHVLHVLHDVWSGVPDFGMGLDFPGSIEDRSAHREEMERAAIAHLAETIDDDWQQGKRVVLATRQGAPFVEIVRYAREHYSELIVMGTHGRTGLTHALLGSVAERVVQKAPCPVLTVPPLEHQFEMP